MAGDRDHDRGTRFGLRPDGWRYLGGLGRGIRNWPAGLYLEQNSDFELCARHVVDRRLVFDGSRFEHSRAVAVPRDDDATGGVATDQSAPRRSRLQRTIEPHTMWPLFALAFCYLTAGVRSDLAQYTVYKGFPAAWQECGEYFEVPNCTLEQYREDSYPCEGAVKELIRCSLINLSAWNDTTGVRQHVIRNYFQPAAEDSCYENRTKECLKQIDSNDDVYNRAYESFRCYYRQYGNLISSAQFSPYESDELVQLTAYSFSVRHIPKCVLLQYAKGDILEEPHFPAVLLTWLLRGGYYSLQNGILLKTLYTQFGHPELLTEQTKQCTDAVVAQLCDESHATKAYQIFKRCLHHIVPILELIQAVAKELVKECDRPCGHCQQDLRQFAPVTAPPLYNVYFREH
ncbi:uncharacterized protein LOC120425151 [Culex pipiens pallens]|uniref:uncharacterized protein LOC120425151 n=1 Tax=Culex pipiens pallens TaxID=42434 RepID=UPI001953CAF0|nr:uncharacterized protein LOC120425151 [Culex pipiens pallens]